MLIFVLLGSVYGKDKIKPENVTRIRLPARRHARLRAIASTAFAGLAIMLVIRRESGILKRLRATPLPASSYIGAVLSATLIAFALEAVTMVVLAHFLFDVHFPAQDRLARPRAAARGALVRGARDRAHRADPLGRGLVGGRERDLPADVVHLGLVLVAARSTRASSR